ncbi:hypothetical protein SNEBB_001144 [Seison nebaliae]|nr:hypothetical protein SNEBB_001144 [Seison nebaliae]
MDTMLCDDFLLFTKTLQNSRKADDRIIHKLNDSIPSVAAKQNQKLCQETCSDLMNEWRNGTTKREMLIETCQNYLKSKMEKEENPNEKRRYNFIIRQIQSEKGVESLLKENTYKKIQDRCLKYYV